MLLAHFISFTYYGHWLRGRAPGWIDGHQRNAHGDPIPGPDDWRLEMDRSHMAEAPYRLTRETRAIAFAALLNRARARGWAVRALHLRECHLHCVVSGMDQADRGMAALKAAMSMALNRHGCRQKRRWTEGGSVKHIFEPAYLANAIRYTLERQGAPMCTFDGAVEHLG